MRIIIDAYNVIRTNPGGKCIEEAQGSLKARQWLIDLCRKSLRSGEEWVLVFDGDGDAAVETAAGAALTVRFSAPRTADEVVREYGDDAVALHIPARIVSSDRDVQVPGCERQDSTAFLDFATKRASAPPRLKTPSKAECAEKIIQALQAVGAALPGAAQGRRFRDELEELLSYFYARKMPPQKMARDTEKFLRDRLGLKPDPHKVLFRALKQVLE
jgi:hypothetical protein